MREPGARAGSYARRQARRRHRAYLWAARRPIVILVAIWYPLLIAAYNVLPEFLNPIALGALLTVPPWLVSLVIVSDPSASAWARGADAEEWTSTELRRRLPRQYRVVHDLQTGNANADHVVVGPGGVFVVETKWSSKAWATDPGTERQRSATRQAKNQARVVGRLLADHGLTVSPTPIVVLWGGGIDKWPAAMGVRTLNGVQVVAGTQMSAWAQLLPTEHTPLPVDAIVTAMRGANTH